MARTKEQVEKLKVVMRSFFGPGIHRGLLGSSKTVFRTEPHLPATALFCRRCF